MIHAHVWSFIPAALVLIMIPGPDQALITRNALASGRRAGLWTMVGGVLGTSVHATLASVGVSALLLASHTAFTVLKGVGTAYLVWMGIQTIRAARASARAGAEGVLAEQLPPWRCVRQGFLSNSLNPKVALFFVTFLPQFLSLDASPFGQSLLLSGVFAVLYLLWFSGYVATVDAVGSVLRRPKVKARVERFTGFLLIAFAVRLVTEQG